MSGSLLTHQKELFRKPNFFISLIAPARLRRSGGAYLNRFNLALVYASFSNIIPSTILTYHALRTGIILEAVLISLALGQHVRLLNRKYMETRKKQNKYMRLESHDSLTNLYNTRAFWQIMEHNLKEAEILEQSLSLAIFDLDHFKRIKTRSANQGSCRAGYRSVSYPVRKHYLYRQHWNC